MNEINSFPPLCVVIASCEYRIELPNHLTILSLDQAVDEHFTFNFF